jgi:hypothetical protein
VGAEELDATYQDEEIMIVNITKQTAAEGGAAAPAHDDAFASVEALTDDDEDDDIDSFW